MLDFIKNLLIAGIALFASEGQAAMPLVINELMASNSRTITDPQGQYDDWIEIYNAGQTAINVGGKYLTDDLSIPTKWRIPNNNPSVTTIQPHGYLLIWADEDIADAGLHANFKLDSTGEELGLFDADGGSLINSITFGEQTSDISYGRYPDGSGTLLYMSTPTPGGANRSGFLGFVADPEFSHKRGFYTAPFSVTISTDTQGVTIYYTLDGSEPNAAAGLSPASMIYTNPIPINKTSCLRAIAVKPGWKPSNIVTNSYIFLDDVIKQPRYPTGFPTTWGQTRVDYEMDPDVASNPAYAPTIKDDLKTIPSVSIVINNADFFDAQKGIYANTQAGGINWERPASIEWIDPIEGTDFQVNVGLRVHGSVYGRTSSVAKHSLRILFKNEYGPSRLEFPLFKDSEVESFESLVLRAIWNYSWFGDSTACGGLGTDHADYLRDQFARDTVRDMKGLAPHSRGVHVYINGLYWGLYILTERPDDGFAAQHLGGSKEDYDVLVANTQMEVQAGDLNAWNTLFNLAAKDLGSTAAYEAIQQYVDVPAMIDYLLMIYYVGSRDAPVLLCNNQVPRNFYAVRRREPPGPFVFLPWDVEWTLESPNENRVGIVGVYNPHYLLDRLRSNPDFRILLADHIHQHFFNDGALTSANSIERYMTRANEIDRAIVGESARWGDSKRSNRPYTRDVEWIAEINRLVNDYFSVRTDVVLEQLRQAGFYPRVDAPVFHINGVYQHGGHISSSDRLSMTAPTGAIYYTIDGSDPHLTGLSNATSSISPAAIRYTGPVTLTKSTHVKSRVLNGSTWSALNEATFAVGPVAQNLRVTEVMYHPKETNDPNEEFIELKNIGTSAINLNLARFTNGIDFTFPDITLVANGYTVVVKDIIAFTARYGTTVRIAGQYSGSLSDGGERIRLEDAVGQTILDFEYKDDWLDITDGGGLSLTVIDAANPDPNSWSQKESWRALNPSPGR